jgi:large subunit ribosomal protein L5
MSKSTLRTKYETEISAALGKQFGVENRMAVPRITKITLNVGISAGNKDPKLQETVETTLSRITGQKPVPTLAKKSIAAFKVRENQVVGMKVTLRGARMYHFLDKLVNVTLARVRDFRGISPKVIDSTGNMSIGFKEHIAFPEIRPDEVERLHGIEIVITTTAGTKERGFALMKAFGFPFSAEEPKKSREAGSASGGK